MSIAMPWLRRWLRPLTAGHPGEAGPLPGSGLLRWARMLAEEVLAQLGVSLEGLTETVAAARLEEEGPNELPHARATPMWRRVVAQLVHFFALMLWAAAAFAFLAQMPQLGLAIIVVIVVNGVFSFVQEYRADRAFRALASLPPSGP